MNPKIDIQTVIDSYHALQDETCAALEQQESRMRFKEDAWERPEGGGGHTRVLKNGDVFEQAGINFSSITGTRLPIAATPTRREFVANDFLVTGVSMVVHPQNPYVPTAHCNVRFFILNKDSDAPIWWFGGGFDLTPYYGFEEDVIYWHQMAKQVCDTLRSDAYAQYKEWCDDYFFIKHRSEPRGVGGIFFDDLNAEGFEQCFRFTKEVGQIFFKAYAAIVTKRKLIPYGERERQFQTYRRGRYVEFNLIYDRGTLFGLQSGGRIESILMSLPPSVRWEYNWAPTPNSAEAELYTKFLIAKDWLK